MRVLFFNVMCSSNISLSTFADDKGISNAKLCQIILTCIVEVRVEPAVICFDRVANLIDGREGSCVQ